MSFLDLIKKKGFDQFGFNKQSNSLYITPNGQDPFFFDKSKFLNI